MKCDCKDWEENVGMIESAITLHISHGMGGIKKSFKYCPYCGRCLIEVKGESK